MHFSVRWNTVLCFLLLTVEETCGQMKPSNAATKIGGTAIFNCSGTSVTPHWYLSKDGTATNQLVIAESCNVNAGFHNNYQTEKTGAAKSCNLLVFNVTMEQAGAYWCTDGIAFFALLTVTDSSPTITHNNTTDVMEGENVVITCSLNYNGSVETAPTLRPHFYWTDNTGNNASNVYNAPPTKNSVVSQLTVTAGREDIMPYTCHVYLQLMPSITAGYANNTPSVDSNASSSNITVLYAPSTPVISSIPEVIAINGVSCGISVLTCSSTGNPTPNYRWFDSAENVILSNNNNLSLAEINQTYKCEAYNTILHNSTSHTVTKEKCTANADCCVFPHNETTSVTVKGCGNGTTCDCSQAYDGIILTCYTKSFPNASYMWKGPNGEVTYSSDYNVTGNGDHRCIAYFNRTLSNYTGDIKFSNGTKETNVKECSTQDTTATHITHLTSTTTPACNDTDCPGAHESGIDVGVIVGIVIGVIVILNGVAIGLFFWYYKRVEVSHSGKIERNNKLRLDRRFPWLKKMMPCVSDTKESVGSNCLWVSLFILLGTLTGIVTFPIWIILANKYENNETSAMNKSENGERNGSGENGRRPTNISLANHNQPPPTNQMNAIHREDPYQNESRDHIELNNSLRSRNLLLSDSPPSRPPPAGRPPPPPNKPTMNSSTNRSKDYAVNDQQTQAANPEHTTYADLPFVPRNTLPTATPVQFLNVSNDTDTYASLNKT